MKTIAGKQCLFMCSETNTVLHNHKSDISYLVSYELEYNICLAMLSNYDVHSYCMI